MRPTSSAQWARARRIAVDEADELGTGCRRSVLSSSASPMKKTNGGFSFRLGHGPARTGRGADLELRLVEAVNADTAARRQDELVVVREGPEGVGPVARRGHQRGRDELVVVREGTKGVGAVAGSRRRRSSLGTEGRGLEETRTGASRWASAPFTHVTTFAEGGAGRAADRELQLVEVVNADDMSSSSCEKARTASALSRRGRSSLGTEGCGLEEARTGAPRWASAPFTHPATLDTVAMDPDLKARVRADLETFAKGRAYYHRLGRVWRRSYLLYGPAGTGKSTFAAAMARFLGYDVYDVDLSRAGDLRALLMQTTPRSLILVEDLDRYLQQGHDKGEDAEARVLSFMDGVASCCGEERVMVFTMRGRQHEEGGVSAAVVRPGRLDVHIRFTLCDFEAFKALASSYLGLKDHKLYPQVEEGFHGARLSAAELGEIMLANRASPSRALRTVITKLQRASVSSASPVPPRMPHRRMTSWSGAGQWDPAVAEATTEDAGGAGLLFGKDGAPMREFKKLYGLIKVRSRREGAGVVPLDDEARTPTASARSSHDKER